MRWNHLNSTSKIVLTIVLGRLKKIYSLMGSFKERSQETLYRRLRQKKPKSYRRRVSMKHRRHRGLIGALFTHLYRLIRVQQVRHLCRFYNIDVDHYIRTKTAEIKIGTDQSAISKAVSKSVKFKIETLIKEEEEEKTKSILDQNTPSKLSFLILLGVIGRSP